MSITIVMPEGKTLHIQDATELQAQQLRACLEAGTGAFEFSLGDRTYVVNCANVLYLEVTPATS